MISLPLTPPEGANTVETIFGDDLGTYATDWVLFEYDPAEESGYRELKSDEKLADDGKGYWILQISGKEKTLTMPSKSYYNYTKPNPFPIELKHAAGADTYRWNLVGVPFNATTKFNDLTFSPGIVKKLWRYKYAGGNGAYEAIEAGGQLNPWDAFWTAADTTENSKITVRTYGAEPNKPFEVVEWEHPYGVLYRPKMEGKRPVIFFAPGYSTGNNEPKCQTKYSTLLNFIASHGYAVICNNADNNNVSSTNIIDHFNTMVKAPINKGEGKKVSDFIDLTKIGILGHSSGGGHSYKILEKFSEKDTNWGKDGRFLFVMEPWFAFGMTKKEMNTLTDTNFVLLQFGEDGNNTTKEGKPYQDPRILLTQYSLTGIADENKDYQIFADADHSYPTGDGAVSEMQGILRPLDALMKYTFEDPLNEEYREAALEVGTDTPYNKDKARSYQKLLETSKYEGDHRCGKYGEENRTFNHCGDYKDHPLPW
jgi:hypothetical protein